MQNVNSTKAKLLGYKSAVYGVALFFLAILQSTFFSKINLFDATPDLLLGAVLTVAIFDEHKVSAVTGIISGFFYCALGGIKYPLYIIFSFLCGYVFWSISEKALSKNYPSFIALAAFIYGVKAIWNIAETSLFAQSFSLFGTLASIVIPEYLSSMVFCSLSYLIFKTISDIFNKKSRKERIRQ